MNPDFDLIESDLISDVLDELRAIAKGQAIELYARCGGDIELALDVVRAAGGEDGMSDVCIMIAAEMNDSWFPGRAEAWLKAAKADAKGEAKFNQETGRWSVTYKAISKAPQTGSTKSWQPKSNDTARTSPI